MKILVVANGVVKGGVSKVLSLLTQEWEKNHDVNISLFRSQDNIPFKIGGRVVLSDIKLRGCIISQVFYLYRILKKSAFDKVIGFSEDANYPLILAARLAGVTDKVILSVHNAKAKANAKVLKRISNQYGYASQIFAVSKGIKADLVSLGIDEEKIVVVPNPVDIIEMRSRSQEFLGIELLSTNYNIVAVGRLHHHKGFDTLIYSFLDVIKNIPAAKLWIIGEGPEKPALEKLIIENKLLGKVILYGYSNNPFYFLNRADVFVLSSRFEGFGLVLIEAMAVGTPVIAFNCPHGPSEIIENEVNGVLVSNQKIGELSSSIVRLYNDKELSAKLIKNGLETALKHDVSTVSQYWLHAL